MSLYERPAYPYRQFVFAVTELSQLAKDNAVFRSSSLLPAL